MKSTKHEIRSTKQIRDSNDKNSERFGFRICNQRGFTLIETLVAIAILLLAISAPLTIAEKGLASAEAARHEITAFYLAQEAIEYVRNVRDSTALAPGNRPWLTGLQSCVRASPSDETGGCGVDPSRAGAPVRPCSDPDMNGCTVMQYTANNDPVACQASTLCGLFGHRYPQAGWTATEFVRRVFIDEMQVNGDDDEAKVTVRIDWQAGALGGRTLRVSEHLLNWHENP